jgi:hypothetical protein
MRNAIVVAAGVVLLLAGCGDPRAPWVGTLQCTSDLSVSTLSGTFSGAGTVALGANSSTVQLKTTLRFTEDTANHDFPMAFDLVVVSDTKAGISSNPATLMMDNCTEQLQALPGSAVRDSSSGRITVADGGVSFFTNDDALCLSAFAGQTYQGTYSLDCTPMK